MYRKILKSTVRGICRSRFLIIMERFGGEGGEIVGFKCFYCYWF